MVVICFALRWNNSGRKYGMSPNELLKEAFHSYQIYIQCTGVLNVHSAKLPLLKWPDVAQSALSCIDESLKGMLSDETLEVLVSDLTIAMFDPITIIHSSAMERIEDVTGKVPPEAVKLSKSLSELKVEDPLKAKRFLIVSINKMFGIMESLAGVPYPELSTEIGKEHD